MMHAGSRRWVVVLAAAALGTGLGRETQLVQMRPRLGPDNGVFRITAEHAMSAEAADQTLQMTIHTLIDLRYHIAKLGLDTLRLVATADSVTVTNVGAPLTARGVKSVDFAKGDSAVVKISTRGQLLEHLYGSKQMITALAVFLDIPSDVQPGSTWRGPPPMLAGSPLNWDLTLASIADIRPGVFRENTVARFDGEQNKGEQRYWAFSTHTEIVNVREDDFLGSFRIQSLRADGTLSISIDGRLLNAATNIESVTETRMQGVLLTTTSKAKVSLDRLR